VWGGRAANAGQHEVASGFFGRWDSERRRSTVRRGDPLGFTSAESEAITGAVHRHEGNILPACAAGSEKSDQHNSHRCTLRATHRPRAGRLFEEATGLFQSPLFRQRISRTAGNPFSPPPTFRTPPAATGKQLCQLWLSLNSLYASTFHPLIPPVNRSPATIRTLLHKLSRIRHSHCLYSPGCVGFSH